MSHRFGLVLILSLGLLSACAVVEPLSGGEKDVAAPKPKLDKMSPANGSLFFQGKEMIIPFDEFFTLVNPQETILVLPPDIRPKAKIKNKSLVLSWTEDLKANTTYAFYLNGTVQDLSERNDSLMCFVFSTGGSVDSLSSTFFVRDAFTRMPLANQTVAMYSSFSDTLVPNYVGKTDASGKATLSYLRPDRYTVVAFDDKNRNLKPQTFENFGFRQTPLDLQTTVVDTTPLLVYPPAEKARIQSLTLFPPSAFTLSCNRSLEHAKLYVNGALIDDKQLLFITRDSIYLPFLQTDTNQFEVVVEGENWSDTSSFRLTEKEKKMGIRLRRLQKESLFANQDIQLLSNYFLSSVNPSLVVLKNAVDSTVLPFTKLAAKGAVLELNFERKENSKSVDLLFLPGALQSANEYNVDTLFLNIPVLSQKEVGNLKIKLENYTSAVIVDLLLKNQLVTRIALEKNQTNHTFLNLLPGEYTLQVIEDKNGNGYWDGGDFGAQKQPENIDLFLAPTRIRGNWDSEITLQKKKNGN